VYHRRKAKATAAPCHREIQSTLGAPFVVLKKSQKPLFDFSRKPLPVIVAANYKGGVGKSVTSRTLVQGLSMHPEYHQGKPILYIDLDSQGNTGRRWNLLEPIQGMPFTTPRPHPQLLADKESNVRSSICDLWLDLLGLGDQAFLPVPYPSNTGQILQSMGMINKDIAQPIGNDLIHIVPNDERQLIDIQTFKKDSKLARAAADSLRDWLRSPELAEQYSFVVIDTPPTRTSVIDIAISAATHIYIPFIPEPQSLDGMYSMISYFLTMVSDRRESKEKIPVPLEFLGILPNIVRKNTKVHKEGFASLKGTQLEKYLLKCGLAQAVAYPETDNWLNSPEHVFADKESKTHLQATKFVKEIADKVMASRAQWGDF